MKTPFFFGLLFLASIFTLQARSVHVDRSTGNDQNDGTEAHPFLTIGKAADSIAGGENDIYSMIIHPGIYELDQQVNVATEKAIGNKRIVIEASILPDDPEWTPEKMPVIVSRLNCGEYSDENIKSVVAFMINESRVTIRGLKFLGYQYPDKKYFSIARFDKEKSDLLVEQCMFLGDKQSAVIQVGIIAHGNGIKVDHCVFYHVNNTVVYYMDSGDGIKTGNRMTHCIIYGANESAIWTASPDKDFVFKHNIVANSSIFWVKNSDNPTVYTVDNCVIVNNEKFKTDDKLNPASYSLKESDVIKEGEISLDTIQTVFKPWPKNHLHVRPNTLGSELGAGIFKAELQINKN